MNSAISCHEIEGCSGLYVDAFRSHATKVRDAKCAFILSHYHADHYTGLARENNYAGPALIHCTPVTAALLREVHQVPAHLVVEHEYGETWTHRLLDSDQEATVSFHDANHCPGAAIVLVELPDGTCHLHTGDMRYHEKMKSYDLLQRAVEKQKLGVVYLDTTYAHPKHDLIPQEAAIENIASFVENVMNETSKTLVLLSCYSIGKEKVLWEASKRSNQLVCVSERKHRMLNCILGYKEDESSQILSRCTLDASKTNLHVIPMGLAGEMWPFFRPNYRACADYAEKLEKLYDRVVAFLPTGWSDASNWNKKMATSKKRLDYQGKDGQVDIEIRLVNYSEHSSFDELGEFVKYLRPRQVVPTVFSDENHRRKIESRFRQLVDSSRAKQHFFKSMVGNASAPAYSPKLKALKRVEADSAEVEVVDVNSASSSDAKRQKMECASGDHLSTLVSMGFNQESAHEALEKCGGKLEVALEALLERKTLDASSPDISKTAAVTEGSNGLTPSIRNFFYPKPR